MQSRYYDPTIGRFINADVYTSTGQGVIGHNMFAYCNNNPANGADYSGTVPANIIFPVCLGGNGYKSQSGTSDGKERSDILLQHIMRNFSTDASSTVYFTVECRGLYTPPNDPFEQFFSDVGRFTGYVPLVIALCIPGVTDDAAVIAFLGTVGTINMVASDAYSLFDSVHQSPYDLIQDTQYEQYQVTISWSSARSVYGYPGVTVVSTHYVELYYIWNHVPYGGEWFLISYDYSASDYTLFT